jgi:hypothetical protein
MIPRTLSASSLQVWTLCPDRWVSEYMDRVPNFDNDAAQVGTTVHGALEMLVKACWIDKTHAGLTRVQQKELLITFYQMSYVQTFGTADFETREYKDGFDLAMRWFGRTNLDEKDMIGVETVEVKETIKIPYNHPDGVAHHCEKCQAPGVCQVDFNYLMDRVDQIDETTWEVVDYKSIRVPITPEELEQKIQARAYALAIQIKHPEATLIKVTFDLLRHEPVSIYLKRDDNIAFWRYLCAETQEIVNRKVEDVVPRLNLECGYCVKKHTCPLMRKNVAGGGLHAIDVDEAAERVEQIGAQLRALGRMKDELEEVLMRHAAATDTLQWPTQDGALEVEITSSRRRVFPAQRAAEIMGPELFAKMGNMTLGNLETIIKDPSMPQETRDQLKELITWTNGNLGVKVKKKTTL